MRRGEIWTFAGGAAYHGKPRPAVIVQDDVFDQTASVTVCGFTSDPTDAPLLRIRVDPSATNGLSDTSRLMIDKVSGNVAYAVMAFGGFLGLGEEHMPVPWDALTYDVSAGGFVTDITEAQVTGAPARSADWAGDRDWETRTFEYYGIPPYWI